MGDVVADWVARMYAAWPVVHHYVNDFEGTEVRGFLISNGLVIDLAFTSAAGFSVWAPVIHDDARRVTPVGVRFTLPEWPTPSAAIWPKTY